ncbi:hypothetical protein BDZ89DRAFT_1065331 [Hymenopellis radicata]|nr:hypothetical protein BDZ89DRAFT_1065331 [Hymenopellis radicata]
MIFASIITFLWIANTVMLALVWKIVDQVFIANGTSLENELNYFIIDHLWLPYGLALDVLQGLCILSADLVLVWRCWVLYAGSFKVVVIPGLCVITEIISSWMTLHTIIAAPLSTSASHTNWLLVYLSMTVATNSSCTFLILFRIVQVSGIGASLKTYRGIIEILVESAAMYAIIYIAILIAYTYQVYTDTPTTTAYMYPTVISYSITGIAPTLIIARVMAGHSRPDDSWTRPSLPHMRSNVLSASESLRFASMPNHSMQTTSANTGRVTANIDLEAQAQEVVEETHEQDGDEDRAEAGPLASGHKLSAGQV